MSEQGVDGARQTHAEQTRLVAGAPEPVAEVSEHAVGEVTLRAYRPDAAEGAIVYLHGGGWVVGTLDTYEPLATALANASGAVVYNVDYRLAPEHPFPAAVADAEAALHWVAEHAADSDRIAVAGDSAGANLATVVARRARAAGGPAVRHQLLVYPALDPTMASASYRELGEGYLLSAADMRWYWHQYIGCADPSHPDLAPALAADLAGLPPATVITAEYDPLRDEGEDYTRTLEAAGVPVTLRRWPGVTHGFFRWRAATPAAGEAIAAAGEALRGALTN